MDQYFGKCLHERGSTTRGAQWPTAFRSTWQRESDHTTPKPGCWQLSQGWKKKKREKRAAGALHKQKKKALKKSKKVAPYALWSYERYDISSFSPPLFFFICSFDFLNRWGWLSAWLTWLKGKKKPNWSLDAISDCTYILFSYHLVILYHVEFLARLVGFTRFFRKEEWELCRQEAYLFFFSFYFYIHVSGRDQFVHIPQQHPDFPCQYKSIHPFFLYSFVLG